MSQGNGTRSPHIHTNHSDFGEILPFSGSYSAIRSVNEYISLIIDQFLNCFRYHDFYYQVYKKLKHPSLECTKIN